MTRHVRTTLAIANRAFDATCGLFLLLGVFVAANTARSPIRINDVLSARLTIKNILLLVLFLGLWNGVFALAGLQGRPSRQDVRKQSGTICRATTIGTIPLLLFPLASNSGAFHISLVLVFWLVATVVEFVGRSLISLFARWISRSAAGSVRLLIVGSGPRALQVFRQIQSEQLTHYRLIGFADSPGNHEIASEVRARIVGTLDELETFLARNAVDQVLITSPVRSCYSAIQGVIATCGRVGVEVHYLADVFASERAQVSHDSTAGISAVRLTHVAQDYRLFLKRGFDIVGALVGLVVLSPLFALCAVLVRLSGPGPAIFTQVRYGFNRRKFTMYKFRTMVADAERLQQSVEELNEATGPIFKIKRDPRITPIGRILRKTSLDELPQLFNVLNGEMSLVGPRPMSIRDVSRFTEAALMRRFSVKPGLTCLWQVNGRSDTTFDRWVELDLTYIDNWSLALDFEILLKTVPAVMKGSGAA